MKLLADLALILGAFAAGTLIALALGASNTGVALGFGQLAFAGMLGFVLLRR